MPCGHPIHEECLDVMIMDRDQLTCPSCRTLIIKVHDPVRENWHADGVRIRLAWPVVNLHLNPFVKYSSLTAEKLLNARRIKCRQCATRVASLKELVKHHTEKHSPEVPRLSKKTFVEKILARLKLKEEQAKAKRPGAGAAPLMEISLQLKSAVKMDRENIETDITILDESALPTTRDNLGLDSELGLIPEEAHDSEQDSELGLEP